MAESCTVVCFTQFQSMAIIAQKHSKGSTVSQTWLAWSTMGEFSVFLSSTGDGTGWTEQTGLNMSVSWHHARSSRVAFKYDIIQRTQLGRSVVGTRGHQMISLINMARRDGVCA